MTYSAHDTLPYVAPTSEQIDQAERWVGLFASRWDRPDADSLRDMMHQDTRNLIPPMKEPGDADAVVEHFRAVLAMLPDFRLDVIRWAPVGDTVMVEWRAHASVAGKPLSWQGVDRICLRDGKTYEGQIYYDTRGVAEAMAAAMTGAQTSS